MAQRTQKLIMKLKLKLNFNVKRMSVFGRRVGGGKVREKRVI